MRIGTKDNFKKAEDNDKIISIKINKNINIRIYKMAISANNIGNLVTGIRGVPTDYDNVKEVFSGMVLTSFDRKNIALNLITTMSIQNGSSTNFPLIARSLDNSDEVANYVIGDDVSTQAIPVKERVINITAPTYYALSISKLEEKLLNFGVRAELSKQMGEALAVTLDKLAFSQVLVASQTSGTIGGSVMQPDGSEVNNDAISTGATPEDKGDALFAALFEANTLLKQKDVTSEPIFVTTPANFNYLVQSGKGVHRDYTSGNGGVDTGTIMQIAGINITWSNNLPVGTSVDVATVAKKLQGLLFAKGAVAMVKLNDVVTEIDSLPTKIGQDLIKSYYWNGFGVLNPSEAVAITGGAFA